MDQPQMNGDSFDSKPEPGPATRPRGVSLFRPGQKTAPPPAKPEPPTSGEALADTFRFAAPSPDLVWESLSPVTLDPDLLGGNGLFTHASTDSAAAAFDILRTRLLQAMAARGWKRIAVTSPTHGCGKSFVAANLALSLARKPSSRTALIDLELRHPGLADILGISDAPAIREFLTGEQPLESHFRRVGRTLALGLNGQSLPDAAELLQEPATADALDSMMHTLAPDVVIYDLPPALAGDDVLSMLPLVDAVLLVADGTRTTAEDIRACERLFETRTPLMGVVLNRSQDRNHDRYRYGRK
ncbi:CpsD/CapB family tyrosine-protein kinase [Paracoccaceae bacterium Fryx2]|nr:CpsD/CapB family tyrosine-protein kinase [Paracoccaceae bacterium Fryx2]